MEICDPIHGSIPLSPQEGAIVKTKEYERLRMIKQLGFSEFSFPGATHNRYVHSIGVSYLAGCAFDVIFDSYAFKNREAKKRLRQCVCLAAMLHDIGHGPLSHTTEEVMPQLSELDVSIYGSKLDGSKLGAENDRKANHEDYTIKYIIDSPISEVLTKQFPGVSPIHVACLVNHQLSCPDDFFKDNDINLRPILNQIVSSELDVDRMDYLERDAYFCGTKYGRVEYKWLIANLTYHLVEGEVFLALNKRALYTFDDFLISRHHMHLMVYFHHRSIIYEEMLLRYLQSDDCDFCLPTDIVEYSSWTDVALYQRISQSSNSWAQAICQHKPYVVLLETHEQGESQKVKTFQQTLTDEGIHSILASSETRLSKYHTTLSRLEQNNIYVVDLYDPWSFPTPIEKCTQIFQRYEESRAINRLYIPAKDYEKSKNFLDKVGRKKR